MTELESTRTDLAAVTDRSASTVRWRILGIIFVLVVINLIDRVTHGIAVPIITGYILQVTGAYLVALYFFAACAALYVLGSLLIDFRQAERR